MIRLPVALYEQEFEWSCVPACTQMALAFLGLHVAEIELCRKLGTVPVVGSEPESLIKLADLGVNIEYGVFSLRKLQRWLVDGYPVITFLRTGPLSYWPKEEPHCVLTVGQDSMSMHVNDPAFPATVRAIPIAEFEAARRLARNRAAVITRGVRNA